MKPYYADPFMTLYGGDCREVLAQLPSESVHTVVTSPPYWGLRDYGTATWEGGDPACDHLSSNYDRGVLNDPTTGHASVATANKRRTPMGLTCRKCGAIRLDSQLGLEPTPEEYVANMVAVFREVWRVLRSDGTLWLNLGDSYSGSWSGHSMRPDGGSQREGGPGFQNLKAGYPSRSPNVPGLKHKDLVGIPWRVAFALQADGWYLRSDIIWAKPNPMPESVTDRPTKAHEYLFLLSKSPRYYFDADAVREDGASYGRQSSERGPRTDAIDRRWSGRPEDRYDVAGRNLRSVWTIATEPYPGAHFATFPRKLVEPCVKAGSPHDGVVLDPFAGSGTTLLVAQSLGRRAIGIDLNPEYLRQALVRNAQAPLGLGA